jgi:hypothetical protein
MHFLVLPQSFGPKYLYIWAISEGSNVSKEKFTYKLHDLWNLMVIREGIKEGWYDKGAL